MTKIECDPNDEEDNLKNCRYSLSCAKDIFQRHMAFQEFLVTSEPFIEKKELRHMHLTEYTGKIVFIVTAMRPDGTIKIISMRDADSEEREIYQKNLCCKA